MREKVVYTVCVNNYFPELCTYTFPLLEKFAQKIGARFQVIKERKFPDFPPTYEKLQIHELGKDNEWNILIDADMLVSSKFPDPTRLVRMSEVGCLVQYQAPLLFEADEYFLRDGRGIGVASNFMVVHRACHDVWTPLEYGYNIAAFRTKRQHILDEFCISRNLSRFGLKISNFYDGKELVGPRKLNPDDNFLDEVIHLDVSNNSKGTVLKVAEKVTGEWLKNI